MKKIVGVMGPGEKQATQEDIECAYEVRKNDLENLKNQLTKLIS